MAGSKDLLTSGKQAHTLMVYACRSFSTDVTCIAQASAFLTSPVQRYRKYLYIGPHDVSRVL